MAYSLSMYQAVSIVLFIATKMEECRYEYLTTKSISGLLGIATPTAVKIINNLNVSGITMAKEGAKGGILLARPLDQITLLDIFLALEHGRPLFKTGMNFNFDKADEDEWRPRLNILEDRVQGSLSSAEKAMKESLGNITIKDIMKDVMT